MEEINHSLAGKYISEDTKLTEMIEEYVRERKTILLVAPQGSGKTDYINRLGDKPYVNSIYTLYPTKGIKNQQSSRTDGNHLTFFRGDECLLKLSNSGKLNSNDLIVIDEVHRVVQYANFAYKEQTTPILKVMELAKDNPCIYVTATPEYLYLCCKDEEFYKNIDVQINIQRSSDNTSYIKHLYLLDELRDQQKRDLIKKNHRSNAKQILLLNNKEKCQKWAGGFEKEGISTFVVHSDSDMKDDEFRRQYNSLLQDGFITTDILIATSWIDIGVSFLNEDISNIYCLFDNEWNSGDLSVVKQFMARTRKSQPNLFLNLPKLSSRENSYMQRIYTEFNEKIDCKNYMEDLINNNAFYDYLYEDIYKTAFIVSEMIKDDRIGVKSCESTPGCIKGKIKGDICASDILCHYYLSRLKEKVQLSQTNNLHYKEFIFDEFGVEFSYSDVVDSTNKVILADDIEQKIIELLNNYVESKEPFTMEELCKKIQEIIWYLPANFTQLTSLLKKLYYKDRSLNQIYRPKSIYHTKNQYYLERELNLE